MACKVIMIQNQTIKSNNVQKYCKSKSTNNAQTNSVPLCELES